MVLSIEHFLVVHTLSINETSRSPLSKALCEQECGLCDRRLSCDSALLFCDDRTEYGVIMRSR